MQTISSLSSQSLFGFQARGSGFCCRSSLLNPRTTRASAASSPSRIQIQTLRSVASASSTQIHLSNLEKLLQKQIVPNLPEVESLRQDSDDGSRENKATNLLEGLNLSKLWPQMKAAEDMSPTHLNRLKRLLSKSQEYSPRNSLGQRWREYHGSKDWAGMLDPLDENLRREVVRHGEFIQAAYHAFHSDPATSEGEGPVPRHVDLPDRSYKVTKSLYATSSVGLPAWVDDVAPDLGWMTQRSSWIGYVAVCDDQREISRMGRRDIVIALRGTATCLEWAENVRNVLVPVPGEADPVHAHPKAEAGFLSLFKTRRPNFPSLAESVVQEVRRLMDLYKGETLSITVTGHSLGAALALLVSDELSTCAPAVPPIAVFSFGGPRVGNRGFANRLNQNNVKVLRVVNSHDVITRVPGIFVSEGLERKLRGSNDTGVLDDKMPWAYSHVGTELRVDSKMSPYLKPNADVACCHDLEAYLHLVDGYLASNCPFRANAKRSLARLLSEQGSNVKKLYISKVKALKIEKGAGQIPTTYLPSPS